MLKDHDCLMLNVSTSSPVSAVTNSSPPGATRKTVLAKLQSSLKKIAKETRANTAMAARPTSSIHLPSDILRALAASGLLNSNNSHEHMQKYHMSQFDDLLLWSCACGDQDLANVFWRETKEPIKWALVIGAVTNVLAKQTLSDANSPLLQISERQTDENRIANHKSVVALVQKWSTMSNDYYSRADAMIAASANEDDAALLGKAWVSNREVLVKLAFNQEIRHTTASSHGILLNHPALKQNIHELWDGKWKTRYNQSIMSYAFFLFLHYKVCSESCPGMAEPGSTPVGMAESFSSVVVPGLFWLWCFSMSIDQCVFGLRTGFTEVSNVWHLCDRLSLTLLQIGIAIRMASVFGYVDALVVAQHSSRLLSWAYIPLWIRVLGYLGVDERTGVGTVMQIVAQIFSSLDNRAFMIILLIVAFSFGMTLSSLSVLDEWQYGVDMHSFVGSSENNFTLDLAFMALNLQTPSFLKESGDTKLDMRISFYVFLIFANTYLVEGFLVGIISDQFSRRETVTILYSSALLK